MPRPVKSTVRVNIDLIISTKTDRGYYVRSDEDAEDVFLTRYQAKMVKEYPEYAVMDVIESVAIAAELV